MAVDLNTLAGAGLAQTILALGAAAIAVSIVVYIYAAIALMAIAKKTKTKNGWLAFIPIANVYLIAKMADLSGWWTLIVLAPMIPFVGSIAMLAVMIWMFWRIVDDIGFPGWTSLLLLVPILNLIMLGVWAWAKK